jgi:hypothetical protein
MALSSKQNLKVRTGNKIVLKVNGQDVGLIQSIRCSHNYGLEHAVGIGGIKVTEYVPSRSSYALSVNSMVLYTGSLLQAGVTLADGEDALKGIVFDIVITDTHTTNGGSRTYLNCSYDSGEIEVSANKIVSASCQFKALTVASGNAWEDAPIVPVTAAVT